MHLVNCLDPLYNNLNFSSMLVFLFSHFSCKYIWWIFLEYSWSICLFGGSLNFNSFTILKIILMNVNIDPTKWNIILVFHWWRNLNRKLTKIPKLSKYKSLWPGVGPNSQKIPSNERYQPYLTRSKWRRM